VSDLGVFSHVAFMTEPFALFGFTVILMMIVHVSDASTSLANRFALYPGWLAANRCYPIFEALDSDAVSRDVSMFGHFLAQSYLLQFGQAFGSLTRLFHLWPHF